MRGHLLVEAQSLLGMPPTTANHELIKYDALSLQKTVPVLRVIYVRQLAGIGDNLNGLITAYWVAQLLNASLELCWPEAADRVTWRIPVHRGGECLTSKRAFESHWSRHLAGVYTGRGSNRTRKQSAGGEAMRMERGFHFHFLVTTPDAALLRCDCTSKLFDRHAMDNGVAGAAWLRKRPTLYLTTNRGMLSFAFDDVTKAGAPRTQLTRLLRERFASPWRAAAYTLQELIALPSSGASPGNDTCLHLRHGRTAAATRGAELPYRELLECATRHAPPSIRVVTDLGSAHLDADAINGAAGLSVARSEARKRWAAQQQQQQQHGHRSAPRLTTSSPAAPHLPPPPPPPRPCRIDFHPEARFVGRAIEACHDGSISHDASDWAAWLQLASCGSIFGPVPSLFVATAAAASGAADVFIGRELRPRSLGRGKCGKSFRRIGDGPARDGRESSTTFPRGPGLYWPRPREDAAAVLNGFPIA
jgi:hypothetical protein